MAGTTFKQTTAQSTGPLTGDYLWSLAANWSHGVPVLDGDVSVSVAGFDDISSLTLDDLILSGTGSVNVVGSQLSVGTVSGGANTSFIADGLALGTSVEVSVGKITGAGGVYGAKGAGAVFDDLSATDTGNTYVAGSGGLFELAAAPNSSSKLEFTGAGTIALLDPGATVAAALDIRSGDTLELPGDSVSGVTIGAHSIKIATNVGTTTFTNVTFGDSVTGYVVNPVPFSGLSAISFGGPDTFQQVTETSNNPLPDDYLWSNSTNWTNFAGSPVNGDGVIVGKDDYDSIDDISNLDLASLTLNSDSYVGVTGAALTVQSLLGANDGIGQLFALDIDGTQGVTVTVDSIATGGSLGYFGAVGENTRFIDNSPTDGGADFDARLGGLVEIAAAPSSKSAFYAEATAVLAFEHPGATVAAKLDGIAAGVAVELPGSIVTTAKFNTSSISITTNLDQTLFSDVVYSGGGLLHPTPVNGYVAFLDPTTGLEEIVFEDSSSTSVSLSNTTFQFVNGEAKITGGGDTIDFQSGPISLADLLDTNANWDTVNGSNGTINLTSAQAAIFGGADIVSFLGAGDAASFHSTQGVSDTLNGSNGKVYLASAQASINGGADGIELSGTGDIATLSGTGTTGDVVGGAGVINLDGVFLKVNNSGDTLNLFDSDTVNLIAGGEALTFAHGIGGLDTIKGFEATDTMQFSHLDFANFTALHAHLTQSGANAVIKLNATDAVTLTGVTASTLTAAEFKFV